LSFQEDILCRQNKPSAEGQANHIKPDVAKYGLDTRKTFAEEYPA
jgi:hypothetical protein